MEVIFLKNRVEQTISIYDQFKTKQIDRVIRLQNNIGHQEKAEHKDIYLTKYYNEISLLKQARKINQESFVNRIRTGGSLIHSNNNNTNYTSKRESQNQQTPDPRAARNFEEELLQKSPEEGFQTHFKINYKYSSKTQSKNISRQTSGHLMRRRTSSPPILIEQDAPMSPSEKQEPLPFPYKLFDNFQQVKEQISHFIVALPLILAKDFEKKGSQDSYYYQGCRSMCERDYESAIVHFNKNLKCYGLIKNISDFNRGVCLFKLEMIEQAKQAFQLNLKSSSYAALRWFNLAVIQFFQGNYMESLQGLEKSLVLFQETHQQYKWMKFSQMKPQFKYMLYFLKDLLLVKDYDYFDHESEDYFKNKELDSQFQSIESLIDQIALVFYSPPLSKQPSQLNTLKDFKELEVKEKYLGSKTQIKGKLNKRRSNYSVSGISNRFLNHQSINQDYAPIETVTQSSPQKYTSTQGSFYSKNEDNQAYIPFYNSQIRRLSYEKQQNKQLLTSSKKIREEKQRKRLKELLSKPEERDNDKIDNMMSVIDRLTAQDIQHLAQPQYVKQTPKLSSRLGKRTKITSKSTTKTHIPSPLIRESKYEEKDEVRQDTESIDRMRLEDMLEVNQYGLTVAKPQFLSISKNISQDKVLGIQEGDLNPNELQFVQRRSRIEQSIQKDQDSDDSEDSMRKKYEINNVCDSLENYYEIFAKDCNNGKYSQGNQFNLNHKFIMAQIANLNLKLTSIKSSVDQSMDTAQNNSISIKQKRKKSIVKRVSKLKKEKKEKKQKNQEDQLFFKDKLRLSEVEQIVEFMEYAKQFGIRNSLLKQRLDEIDDLLVKLNYFSKFPFKLRKEIIEIGRIKVFQKDEVIFNQGDINDEFYVLLRGTVQVSVVKEELGYIPFIVYNIYDGKDFGETNHYEQSENLTQDMITDLKKQKYTCKTLELCHVFLFNKKLEIGMHILLPLASTILSQTYKIGDYILKEGEVPKGLYLIYSGQCKVGTETVATRKKNGSKFKRIQAQLKNFTYQGNFDESSIMKQIEKKHQVLDKEDDNMSDAPQSARNQNQEQIKKRIYENEKVFFDENGKKIKNQIAYRKFDTFFTLTVKDYFGGKVLVLQERKNKGESFLELQDDSSMLSVVADSADVEVLIITKTHLGYLPEDIQKLLQFQIGNSFQPDRPYEQEQVDLIKKKFEDWEDYKLKTVNEVMKSNYVERKKYQLDQLKR